MVVNVKKLIGLPVQTRSGMALGKVGGVEIETNTGRIATLHVKTRTPLVGKELCIVTWVQIMSLTDKEVVVDDAVVPVGAAAMAFEGAEI